MEIQKIEYLENKKSFLFLDDKKSLSTFFYGLPFGEKKKNRKKKRKKADRILQLQVSGLQLYWKRDSGVSKFLRTHLHNISLQMLLT